MPENRWAPPEHQNVPIYAAESMPLDEVGSAEPVDPPQPVTVHGLRFEAIGVLEQVRAFASPAPTPPCSSRSPGRAAYSGRGCLATQ